MVSASGYILHVPPNRREVILDRADENRYCPTQWLSLPQTQNG
jgi:hypothetical protein